MPEVILLILAVVAGAIASVSGFGIGSILTPVLAHSVGMKVAVAAVTIPHLVASALRLWMLRRSIDRKVLFGFGLASAIGGLAGAAIAMRFSSAALTIAFGVVVSLAGIAELTGAVRQVEWSRGAAWIAGILSGALGGLVGNQGGIRTAAMLGFNVPKESFIATGAAIALFVDGARLPVYLMSQGDAVRALWPTITAMIVAVVIGTWLGLRVLKGIPQQAFRRVLGALLFVLGMYMIISTRA